MTHSGFIKLDIGRSDTVQIDSILIFPSSSCRVFIFTRRPLFQGTPSLPLSPPSSSVSSLPPPSLLLLLLPFPRCYHRRRLCVLRAAQRGHGGLSRRYEQGLRGAGDQTAEPVRLQPGQDLRQRPVAAVEVVRLCRYTSPRRLGWGAGRRIPRTVLIRSFTA